MKRQNPLQKATRRIETEGRRHCLCIYSATAMALWQHWGKKQEAINRIFELSHDVWNECAKDHDHSMIQMCETQTGMKQFRQRHGIKSGVTGCSDCLMDGDGFGCRRVHNVPAYMSDEEVEIVFDDFKQMIEELKRT